MSVRGPWMVLEALRACSGCGVVPEQEDGEVVDEECETEDVEEGGDRMARSC